VGRITLHLGDIAAFRYPVSEAAERSRLRRIGWEAGVLGWFPSLGTVDAVRWDAATGAITPVPWGSGA
jgi:hypothetical protein